MLNPDVRYFGAVCWLYSCSWILHHFVWDAWWMNGLKQIFSSRSLHFSVSVMLVFLKKRTKSFQNSKAWLAAGIKTSCSDKRKLCLLCRKSNDAELKIYYKNYWKILSKVITLAKKLYYNNKLANSTNKPKTTRSIIKTVTNNKKNFNNIITIVIDGKTTTHQQTIAEKFNNYYVSVADNITNNNPINSNNGDLKKINPLDYLYSWKIQVLMK